MSQIDQNERVSDVRRKYPKDMGGNKDEWKGVEIHLSEINDELYNIERNIKLMKQKDMKQGFETKQLERMLERQAELEAKQQDTLRIQANMNHYHQSVLADRENKKMLQGSLSNEYQNLMQDARSRQQEQVNFFISIQLAKEREFDNRAIDDNRRKMESSERRKREKLEAYRAEMLENKRLMDDAQERKRQEKERDRQEFNALVKYGEKKAVMRDQNYKRFFNGIVQSQNEKEKLYEQNVLRDLQRKEAELIEKINNSADEYSRRKFLEELEQLKRRMMASYETAGAQKMQIQEVEGLKEQQMNEKLGEREKRLKALQDYQEYLKDQKNMKLQNQNGYYNELNNCQTDQQNSRSIANRMTEREKKMNVLDLQAFKAQDTSLYSLIPGYTPQIGGMNARYMGQQDKTAFKDNDSQRNAPVSQSTNNIRGQNNSVFAKSAHNNILV